MQSESKTGETISAGPTAVKIKPKMAFYIDVFSFCNLRCPSCPVENWPREDKAFTKGLMTEELLRRILEKATMECKVGDVALYNYTEPLLHPNLPRLVRVVKSFGLRCLISSNLNILRNPDELMAANPDSFRVSVSGFHQEIYERGHRRGNSEKVKENMRLLAEAKVRQGALTRLELYFHKYIDNEEDELPMRAYAEELGYTFFGAWAYMTVVEKVLSYINPDQPEAQITDEDLALMDRLALPTHQAVDVASRHDVKSCALQDEFMTIDVEGNVFLCCATSGRPSNMIGKYLELSLDAIQAKKRAHRLCGPCMKHGLPVYFNYGDPEFDEIGNRTRAAFRAGYKKAV